MSKRPEPCAECGRTTNIPTNVGYTFYSEQRGVIFKCNQCGDEIRKAKQNLCRGCQNDVTQCCCSKWT